MYIQANIGRNIGSEPMTDSEWHGFIDSVKFAFCFADQSASIMSDDISIHYGQGEWDGVPEESAYISFFDANQTIDIKHLKTQFRIIKKWYEQDTIALVIGSELI